MNQNRQKCWQHPLGSLCGANLGVVYFFGEEPYEMRDLLKHQEELDFYV
ncbi:hypothetical protein [Marinobacter vulgaris]|nr:hypothetical protein [Marinobacter vulgaris]